MMSIVSEFSIDCLFPVCYVPTCPLYNTRHALPWQKKVFSYSEIIQYTQGGVGSAKTIGYACKFVFDMIVVPNNEGIVLRKDYELNFQTTWKRVNECIDGLVEQGFIDEPERYNKINGVYTQVKLANGSHFRAGQTKNISEYLGPEYGSILLDDAMESSEEVWIGYGTQGGLESRLRHAAAAYFEMDGQYYDMRRGYIITNPPPGVSGWWRLFGRKPGVRYFPKTTVKYRHLQVSSLDNDHLPPNYADTLASHHTEDEIKRILKGESVVDYGGKPVYDKCFFAGTHTGQFGYDPRQPLLVCLDFGYEHPAITFAQLKKCVEGNLHYITLSEIANLYNISTLTLIDGKLSDDGDSVVKGCYEHHLEVYYPSFDKHMIYHACDIAGFSKTPSQRDTRGSAVQLESKFGFKFFKKRFEVDNSIERVRKTLRERCKCGYATILVDRKCFMLIEALGKGYVYPRKKDGTYDNKPKQDHQYEDIADAWRYGVEHYLHRVVVPPVDYNLPPDRSTYERYPGQWLTPQDSFDFERA